MRSVLLALALFCGTTANAGDMSGFYFGAGAGGVYSSGAGTVSRTTRVPVVGIVDQLSTHQDASDTGATFEFVGLYQKQWGMAVAGIEAAYQFRDLEIKSDGSIFAPGATAVAAIGDRAYIRTRLGLEIFPGFVPYTSAGISYAWDNESYLRLANGTNINVVDTSTWNAVFGGGIEYQFGDFLLDLRVTAAPGKDSHNVTVVNQGLSTITFETTTASGWTYDAGIRLLYKLQ